MDKIIMGTTPTIKYTFKSIAPTDITIAYLTITYGENEIERDITTATVSSTGISWTLTQEETLGITDNAVVIRLNWKTADGTRGASSRTVVMIETNELDEVI